MLPVRRLAANGLDAWAQVVGHGYENLVAKDEASVYEGGPTRRWLKGKQKCRSADQLEPDVDGALGAGSTVMENAMDSDFTCKGAVTRLLESGGIEIDGRVVVVPQVLLGVSVRVGDQVELMRVRKKSGRYINVVRVSADPNTIVGERVRVNGDWAPAAEVETSLVQMLGPEIAARMMEEARETQS